MTEKELLNEKTKVYFLNFFYYLLIVAGVVFAFGFFRDEDHTGLTYWEAYVLVSFVCVILLGNRIASGFAENVGKKPKVKS